MPHIRIPQTGTTIDWPPAETGRIRINAKLHLSDQLSESSIGIELSFKRDPFRRLFKRSDYWCRLRSYAQREAQKTQPLTTAEQEQLDRFRPRLGNGHIEQLPPDLLLRQWGHDIASTLQQDSYADAFRRIALRGHLPLKRPSRRSLQTINGHFQGIDYRLAIDHDDLKSLRTYIATESGARRLLFEMRWNLLPTALVDYALCGLPRGNKHALIRHDLMVIAGYAVFVAGELVKKATHDQALWSRLQHVLVSEECGWMVRKPLQILTLADRALRPALVRYHIKPLVNRRDISDILDPAARKSHAEFFNSLPEWLSWWFDLLLGEEGQAARALKLIK